MASRVETYVHSDSVTQNKGASMVEVHAETEFATRTDSFIAFAKKVARMAYGAAAANGEGVLRVSAESVYDLFPELHEDEKALETELKEKVFVGHIVVLPQTPAWRNKKEATKTCSVDPTQDQD